METPISKSKVLIAVKNKDLSCFLHTSEMELSRPQQICLAKCED